MILLSCIEILPLQHLIPADFPGHLDTPWIVCEIVTFGKSPFNAKSLLVVTIGEEENRNIFFFICEYPPIFPRKEQITQLPPFTTPLCTPPVIQPPCSTPISITTPFCTTPILQLSKYTIPHLLNPHTYYTPSLQSHFYNHQVYNNQYIQHHHHLT